MPYANNQCVNIYYEVEGHGPPIAFIHGGTGNLNSWRTYGYVELLKDKYTLILIDARGHGESDKPHDSTAYDYRLLTDDVIAVLDACQIDRCHFWGYSLGGYVGFALAKHFPTRLRTLILGGCSPCAERRPTTEPPSPFAQVFQRGIQDGPDAVVRGMEELFGTITPHYAERLRKLDYQAMVAFMDYWDYQLPNLDDVLPTMTMPCLIYIADGDDPEFAHTKEYMKQMPNAMLLGLTGYNHVNANTALDRIMPQVLPFLAAAQ